MGDDIVLPVPKSIPECIEELTGGMGDTSRCYVWRGQANSSWLPYPGLYRRLMNEGFGKEEIDESLITMYERDIFCEANGLGLGGDADDDCLSFMVQLQHAGGATRLLDVTRDPFVALWFATGGAQSVAGIVYRYAIDCSCHAQPEGIREWQDITREELAGIPVLFTPRRLNNRIAAQSAAFLTSVLDRPLSEGSVFYHETLYSSVKPILIQAELKAELRDYLRNSRGMRSTDLFPDFDGFAQANGQDSPFPRKKDALYGQGEMVFLPKRFNPFGL